MYLRVGILQLFYRDWSSPLVLWRGQRDYDPMMLCSNPLIPNTSLSLTIYFHSMCRKNLSLGFRKPWVSGVKIVGQGESYRHAQ